MRAQLPRRVPGKQRFQSPLSTETDILSGNLLDTRDELRIERHTSLTKRHQWNGCRTFRSRRKNSSAGPGRLLPGLAFLKNGDAYAGERQLKRDGSADEPSSGDDGLEFLNHFLIGAQPVARKISIALERACQLLRQHFGLLRGGLRPCPVSVICRITCFSHEAAHFRREILLRSVQRLSFGRANVAFRDTQALAGLLLRRA